MAFLIVNIVHKRISNKNKYEEGFEYIPIDYAPKTIRLFPETRKALEEKGITLYKKVPISEHNRKNKNG